jgi:hypothetical protein
MARGEVAKIGDTRVAPNGYHYTKVASGTECDWRLTHHIKMEEILGRPLRPSERVHFRTANKQDFSPDNIYVIVKGTASIRKTLARLYAKKTDVEQEIKYWEDELETQVMAAQSEREGKK